MSEQSTTYQVTARVVRSGVSLGTITGKSAEVEIDTSAGQSPDLPGPADLLVTAFAACVLKNVERMSRLQRFDWHGAEIVVTAERAASPPRIERITYRLTVETDEPPRTMELLHRNIAKHGTIYNTLAQSCEVAGELVVRPVTTLAAR